MRRSSGFRSITDTDKMKTPDKMIALGDKRGLYTGMWVIAALLLAAYNGFTLVSMFDPPIVGRSHDVKLASDKWRRLQERAPFASGKENDDLDLILSKFVMVQEKKKKEASAPKQEDGVSATESDLPVLTGIMRSVDARGTGRFFAVMEGKTYAEKAEVRGYLINKITERGIVLLKAGINRFVPTPEVYFSSDRSGSATEKGVEPPETLE